MKTTEKSRKILRDLLSRRQVLFAAGGLVTAGGLMDLAGCGGGGSYSPGIGGGGQSPSGFVPVTGLATLPSGTTLQLSTMTVGVAGQNVPVAQSGSFSVSVSASGPAVTVLLDSTGKGVLMSMVDSTSSVHAINTHTTSVALLYFAVGAYMFPTASMSKILALIDADPAVAALEAVVVKAVNADPHALVNNASTLSPAVTQALNTMLGSGTPSVRASGKGSGVQKADTVPTLLLTNPTSPQDGVTLSQDSSSASILLENEKRRPCSVYVYETTTLTGTTTVDVNPAKLVSGPFYLDSTENLSLFTSLKDFTTFFHGTSPWSPVYLPLIPINLEPGTDRTTYQVIVLLSSFKSLAQDGLEPSFFHDPHFANEVSRWRADYNKLFLTSVFGDILLPLFCLFFGFGSIVASRTVIAGVVAAAAAAQSATFVRVISQLQYGSIEGVSQALADVVNDALRSDTSSQFWSKEVQQVIGQAEARALQSASQVLASNSTLTTASSMFSSVFGPVFLGSAILGGFDLGAVVYDVFNSDIGVSWTVLDIRQLLNLKPQNPYATPGDRVSFTVTPPSNVNGTFVYDWTQTSTFATLSSTDGKVGNSIETSSLSVDLVTTGSDTKPVSVVVIGYDVSTGSKVEIGRASTTVKFYLPCSISPSTPSILKGQNVVLVATLGGSPPSGLTYRWTLTGTSGTIGSSNVVTTSSSSVNYIANADGSDQIHLDVLDSSGAVIAKADVVVEVGKPTFTLLMTFTNWPTYDSSGNLTHNLDGTYSYQDGQGSGLITDNKSYDEIDGYWDNIPVVPGQASSSGWLLELYLPKGTIPQIGQAYSYYFQDVNHLTSVPGTFELWIAPPLNNPINGYSQLGVDNTTTTGSLMFTSLTKRSDGTYVGNFSFTISDAKYGGKIVGTGVGGW